jgi:hypothetical protein
VNPPVGSTQTKIGYDIANGHSGKLMGASVSGGDDSKIKGKLFFNICGL